MRMFSRSLARSLAWTLVQVGLLVLLLSGQALGDSVDAQVDRTTIRLDEYVNLLISIQGSGDPDLSVIQDFAVVGRSSSINFSLINGSFSKTVTLKLMLQPLKQGQASIPPIPVDFDGNVLMSDEIQITVTGGYQDPQPAPSPQTQPGGSNAKPGGTGPAPQQQPPQAPDHTSNDPIFLEAHLSKDEMYIGETVLYTLRVFYRVGMLSQDLVMPPFDAFHSERLGQAQEYVTTVNGIRYKVAELRYLLSAAQPGEMTIGQAVLHCDMIDGNQPMNPFDMLFRNAPVQSGSFPSNQPTVTVKALPEYDGDVPFSGLVGQFDLAARLEPEVVRQGDSATLYLTVSGQGNIRDAGELQVEAPPSMKLYPGSPELEALPQGDIYVGSKEFSYVFVPLEAGEYPLGEASLCWFDPVQETYQTARAELPKLTVLAGDDQEMVVARPEPGQPGVSEPVGQVDKQEVDILHKDIMPLKPDADSPADLGSMNGALFWLLLLIPPLLLGGMALARRLGARRDTLARRLDRKVRTALDQARDKVGADNGEALSLCARALLWTVHRTADVERGALTYDEVRELLSVHGHEQLAEEAAGLMQRLDNALYGGGASDSAHVRELVEETRNMVERLCA